MCQRDETDLVPMGHRRTWRTGRLAEVLGFDFQRRICAAVKQPPFAVPVRSGSYQMCRGDRQPKILTAPGIPKRVRVFLNSSNTTGPPCITRASGIYSIWKWRVTCGNLGHISGRRNSYQRTVEGINIHPLRLLTQTNQELKIKT